MKAIIYPMILLRVVATGRVYGTHRELSSRIRAPGKSMFEKADFFRKLQGVDTRYPQEKVEPETLEKHYKQFRNLEYLRILKQDPNPFLAKRMMDQVEDPCLAMYLTAGGFYKGSGFDDDDDDFHKI